jgi:O-antigen/teichoic acid export membrane protein
MSDLGNKAKSSVLWNTGFNFFRDTLQFLVMLVLVRLISPDLYGRFALVTSIMTFIHVFSFNTFIQHVLQIREDSKVNYQLHFSFGLILQISLFVLTNVIIYILNLLDIYREISVYLHVLSFVFFFELFSELYRIQLQRELDWKRMRILHSIGLLLGSLLAIYIAYIGGGVYALIIPGFISNIPFIYELLVTNKWRPTYEWKYLDYKETIDFSLKRILSGLAMHGKPLIENSLITAMFSFTQLGYYNRAIGLCSILVQKFTLQFVFAIYPVLTKVEPFSLKFRRISGLILSFTAWFIFPMVFILVMTSENLVYVLYGEKWLSVIPFIGPAGVMIGLFAFKHVIYSLVLSSHFEKICSIFDLSLLVCSMVLLILTIPYGLIYYLYAQVLLLTLSIVFLVVFSLVNKIFLLRSVFTSFAAPLICGVAAYSLVILFRSYVFIDSAMNELLLDCLIFFLAYSFTIRILFKTSLLQIVEYLPFRQQLMLILFLKNINKLTTKS